MAKTGRKNKYETHVKPFLDKVEKWCNTMTEQQIAKKLGVGYSTFFEYKREFPELAETIKKGRIDLVSDLRSTLIKRAKGFTFTETKTVKEYIEINKKMRDCLIANGYTDDEISQTHLIRSESTLKYALPDVAALNLALKNYDKDNWANDPQTLDIKKQELKLKEKQIENTIW